MTRAHGAGAGDDALAGFPYAARIAVRFADIDAMNHVNNAVFVTYLEVARTGLWRERLGFAGGARDVPFIVARVAVDYRSPIRLEDDVVVGVGVARVGTSSFTMVYRIEASGRVAANAESVQVYFDYAAGRPAPLPDALRERLSRLRPTRRT